MPDINKVREDEIKSLRLELSSCESILRLIDDQQARYISPQHIPLQLKRDAELLRERSAKIRKLLGN